MKHRHTVRILGITATGTTKDWLQDIVGFTVLTVTWGALLYVVFSIGGNA